MKKSIFASLLLVWCCGCVTPQVVYENLDLVRENIEIQKDITDLLLSKVVKPNTPEQVEAIALQKIETEERWDKASKAINRLIIFLEAERYVDYAISVTTQFGPNELLDFLKKIKGEIK